MAEQYEEERLCPLDHRECPPLTKAQIDEIAERAADRALERVYTNIGKSVVQKFLWWAGAAAVAATAYFKGKGVI